MKRIFEKYLMVFQKKQKVLIFSDCPSCMHIYYIRMLSAPVLNDILRVTVVINSLCHLLIYLSKIVM